MPDDIPAFLDRRPFVWSFTILHTYKNVCPYQMAQRYIYKTTPYVETPAMKWGNEVHAALEHRVGAGKPLPEPMMQWEKFAKPFDGRGAKTEMKLGVTMQGTATGFFDKNVWGRGKVDTTLMNDTTAYFCDWKTGKSDYEDRFELDVQAVLLNVKFPQLRSIVGQYAWLKEDRLSEMYDLSDTRKTWNEIGEIVRAIEADKKSGEFKKKRSGLCLWCDVYDCENNKNPKKSK